MFNTIPSCWVLLENFFITLFPLDNYISLLLQATLSVRPNPEAITLLKEHGIIYKSGRFTEEEDDLIKKNWERYREINELEEEKVDFFLPRRDENTEAKEKWDFIKKTLFYPHLCKGLESRFAQQVGLRFFKLYDPAVRKGYRDINGSQKGIFLPQDIREKIVFLRFEKRKSLYNIAEKLRLTITEVRNTVTNYSVEQKQISSRIYKKLLKTMERKAGKSKVKEIIESCVQNDQLSAFKLSEDLPFFEVSEMIGKNEQAVKNIWFFIIKVLIKLCQHWKTQGRSDEEACKAAIRCIVTKRKPRLTNEQMANFFDILLTYLTPKAVHTGSFRHLFDTVKVENSCIERMVFLFQASNGELTHLFKIVTTILCSSQSIFERISTDLTLFDKITVFRDYYTNICILIDSVKQTDPCSSVYRNPFLDTLAIFLSQQYEESRVPKKWKNYINEKYHEQCE